MSATSRFCLLFFLLLALLYGCSESSDNQTKRLHTIQLYAEPMNVSSRATLQPDDTERLFEASWEQGDMLSVDINSLNGEEESNIPFSYDTSRGIFEAQSALEGQAVWHYRIRYPYVASGETLYFGPNRQQCGNGYNSAYDLMWQELEVAGAEPGMDPAGKPLHFALQRALPLLYFHLSTTADWASMERVVRVTLEADVPIAAEGLALDGATAYAVGEQYNQISLTFTDPPLVKDMMLWFNTLPCEIGEMTLRVESEQHNLTLRNKQGGSYEAGILYKSLISPPAEVWKESLFRLLEADQVVNSEECLFVVKLQNRYYALPRNAELKGGRIAAAQISVGEDGCISLRDAEPFIWQIASTTEGYYTLYNGESYLARSSSTSLSLSKEPFAWSLLRDDWGLNEMWRLKLPKSEHSLLLYSTNLNFGAFTTWGGTSHTAPIIYVKAR